MHISINLSLIALLSFFITKPIDDFKQIVQISVPKCGTHLLAKCIWLLTGKTAVDVLPTLSGTVPSGYLCNPPLTAFEDLTNLPPANFWITHLFYNKTYATVLIKPQYTTFFIYRDPRDQVVSLAFYMLKDKNTWPDIAQLSLDDLLLDIIAQGTSFKDFPCITGGITHLYNAYLPWLQENTIVPIRFEDLIGQRGGGSAKKQLETLQKICKHLDIPLTNSLYEKIMQELFGNSNTFREGKIGAWKTYFKPIHISAFKKVAGQLLIKLNYENDLNW